MQNGEDVGSIESPGPKTASTLPGYVNSKGRRARWRSTMVPAVHRLQGLKRPTPPPAALILLPLVLLLAGITLLHNYGKNGLSILASQAAAPEEDDPLEVPSLLPYHELYTRLPPGLGMSLLILWLMFLFSFLGIVASDFFCPNLSTLASRLGLPEDVAGATMVGWANGAPDVFSTFASLKAGSGSLAIGELIGAASFICSVVAGSMVLIKPFKVGRYNFWRDVGFFTIAVAVTLAILKDGSIQLWEAKLMVALYGCYVLLVTVGSYWRRRRWRQRERERLTREAWLEHSESDSNSVSPHRGDPDFSKAHPSAPTSSTPQRSGSSADARNLTPLTIPSFRFPNTSRSASPSLADEDYFDSPLARSRTQPDSARHRSRIASISHQSHHSIHAHSHSVVGHSGHARSKSRPIFPAPGRLLHRSSILGAIEFRDVVNSLAAESSANKHLSIFESNNDIPEDEDAEEFEYQRFLLDRRKHGDLEAGHSIAPRPSPVTPNLRRPRSFDGAYPGRRKNASGKKRKSRKKKHDENGLVAPLVEESAVQDSHYLGGESALRPRRYRAISNPTLPTNSDMYMHYGNTLGNPSPTKSTKEPPARTAAETLPDMQVDDPWKGSPDASSPPHLLLSRPTITDWDDAPSRSSTLGQQQGAGPESEATVTPMNSAKKSVAARAKVPHKALRLLGLANQPQDGSPVAKKQRLLRIISGGAGHNNDPFVSTTWEDLDKHTFSFSASFRKFAAIFTAIVYAIFPSLHNFRSKSVLAMVTSLISVPAVLVLNLTLPVVDESGLEDEIFEEKVQLDTEDTTEGETGSSYTDSYGSEDDDKDGASEDIDDEIEDIIDEEEREERRQNIRRAIAVAQELHSPVATHAHRSSISLPPLSEEARRAANGSSILLSPSIMPLPLLEGDQELVVGNYIVSENDLTRYLTAIQCFLAPIFVVLALLGDDLKIWYLPAAAGVGLALSAIAIIFFTDIRHPIRVLTLCSIGFCVAIVWILTIVNEVVGVLQTIGHVFGLSDAILGLTIFAMGNSLGDLVANVTVARMGYPLMAMSACFGGPMLNILLGIGVSGTYLISTNGEPISVPISTTLVVSGLGLLVVLCGTLITVPLNGYVLSRKWGSGLIAVYVAVMIANVVVEIKSER